MGQPATNHIWKMGYDQSILTQFRMIAWFSFSIRKCLVSDPWCASQGPKYPSFAVINIVACSGYSFIYAPAFLLTFLLQLCQ